MTLLMGAEFSCKSKLNTHESICDPKTGLASYMLQEIRKQRAGLEESRAIVNFS